MSEPVTPVARREATGFVALRGDGPRGMISLRADLSSAALKAVCNELTGQDIPGTGEIRGGLDGGLAWMSPDEVLVLVPYAQAGATQGRLAAALASEHHLAVNVSDARAVMVLSGAGGREVLAKLSPADLSPGAFGPGQIRRTRLGQIAAAFWMADPDTIVVICFRSVGHYAFDLLAASIAAGPVGAL